MGTMLFIGRCVFFHFVFVSFLFTRAIGLSCLNSSSLVLFLPFTLIAGICIYMISNGVLFRLRLHFQAYKGHTAVLASLIRLQMAVEFKDSYGQTALHLASLRGNLDCVEYLILQANVSRQTGRLNAFVVAHFTHPYHPPCKSDWLD